MGLSKSRHIWNIFGVQQNATDSAEDKLPEKFKHLQVGSFLGQSHEISLAQKLPET